MMNSDQVSSVQRLRPPRVLVSAASKHGSTAEIAQAIGDVLSSHGIAVALLPPEAVESVAGYDAVILGSAVYSGHWMSSAEGLASRSAELLANRPVWLFSSGPVGRPGGKLAKAMGGDPLELASVRAVTHARDHRMFAGKLDPANLAVPQRLALSMFRSMRGDFRPWQEIRGWAEEIAQDLAKIPGGQSSLTAQPR